MALPRPVPLLLRQRQQQPAYQQPETEESLLAKIGKPVLGGVSMVANLLDVPASVGRDVVGGVTTGDWNKYNPIDQLASPLSHDNRVYYRDLLSDVGLMKPNKETGFHPIDDPMEAVRDLTGFGLDVVTDPFFFAPKQTLKGLGALGRGVNKVTDFVPFAKPVKGAVANLGRKAKYTAEGLFDSTVMGRSKPEVREAARRISREKAENLGKVTSDYLPMMRRLEDEGLLTAENSKMLRDVLENTRKPEMNPATGEVVREPGTPFIDPETGASHLIPGEARYQPVVEPGDVPPLIRELADKMESLSKSDLDVRQQLDDIVGYASRRMGADFQNRLGQVRQTVGDKKPLGVSDPGDIGRAQRLKGFEGGTNEVNRILSDPRWEGIIKSAKSPAKAIDQIADIIGKENAHTIRPLYVVEEQIKGKVIQTTKDRYKELAKDIVDYYPEFKEFGGLFTNHPVVDAMVGHLGAADKRAAQDNILDLLANRGVHGESVRTGLEGELAGGETVGDVLKQMGMNPTEGSEEIAKRMGLKVPTLDEILATKSPVVKAQRIRARKDALKLVRETKLKEGYYDDITGLWPSWKVPDEAGPLKKFWKDYTALFKMGVLAPWPARYMRDVTSGLVRNWDAGLIEATPGSGSMRSWLDANQLIRGKTVQGLKDIPAVQEHLVKTGKIAPGQNITDEMATKAVAELYASHKGTQVYANTDLPIPEPAMGRAEEYLDMIPGRKPLLSPFKESPNSWNPLKTRGVRDKATGQPRQTSEFGAAKAGEIAGRFSDDLNRLHPFIHQLRKGTNPAEAMKRIMQAQIDYSPKNFTKFEKGLREILPFYSFAKGNLKYVAKEITSNPGGRLGRILRAQNQATGSPDTLAPEYIQENASIPLGTQPDGSDRYLGPLGLMHEDAFGLLAGDSRSMLEELGSRSHPLIKGPVEWMTGQSLFRRDMPLDELDPSLGRIATNLGLQEPSASGRAKPLGGPLVEHGLANTPISRAITSARTLTDPRKSIVDRAVNLLSGVRITDVPPWQREGIIRDKATEIAKQDLGARSYSKAYIPKEEIAAAEAAGNKEAAESMKAFNLLMRELDKKQRERKKAAVN